MLVKKPFKIPFTFRSKDPRRRRLIRRRVLVGIAFIVAGIYYACLNTTPLKIAQHWFDDNGFRLYNIYGITFQREKTHPKDIVFITVDDISLTRLGTAWPLERPYFVKLLNKLSEQNPKVIALDFLFAGKKDLDPETDIKLADAMKKCGNVILISGYEDGDYVEPYQPFAEASAGYGVIGAVSDVDGGIRQFRTSVFVIKGSEIKETPFEIKVAARYLDIPYESVHKNEKTVVIGSESKQIELPLNRNGFIFINYLTDIDEVKTVPAWKVIKGVIPKETFKNKLVLISPTAQSYGDFHDTPFGERPGGLVIVNTLNTIISSSFLKEADPRFVASVTVFFYILGFFVFYKTYEKRPLVWVLTLAFILIASFIASFVAILNNVIFSVFHIMALVPILYIAMASYTSFTDFYERKENERVLSTDSHSGFYNDRHFPSVLDPAVSNALFFKHECSLIMIEAINLDRIMMDRSFIKGKTIHDQTIEIVREILRKGFSVEYIDFCKFAILMPYVGINEAVRIAASMQDNIKRTDFEVTKEYLKPVFAIGVASVNSAPFIKTGDDLKKSAQAAMTRAQKTRPNEVIEVIRFNPDIDNPAVLSDDIKKEATAKSQAEFDPIEDSKERDKREIDYKHLQVVLKKYLERAHYEAFYGLTKGVELRDRCTGGHSLRVGDYVEKVGRRLNIPEEDLRLLKRAATIHDVGKIMVPDDILNKEGLLTDEERLRMQLHPEASVWMLSLSKYFRKMLPIIRAHHERLDGSGYPRHLKGNEIPFESQIIAVVDAFDATTHDRPYRKAMGVKEAMDDIIAHDEKYNRHIALTLKEILIEEGLYI